MTVEEMRVAIAKVYNGPAWIRKVHNMPDYQVTAIYFSFLESGKFDKPKQPVEKHLKYAYQKPDKEYMFGEPYVGVQLTIFD